MHSLYQAELDFAKNLPSNSERLSHLSSILRSILQVASISAIEVIHQAAPGLDGDVDLVEFVDRFGQPSDGLPIEVLDRLVPTIRGLVSRQYFLGWFEPREGQAEPLVNSLGEWVRFRNRRLGHGVVDAPITAEWADKTAILIEQILSVSKKLLPRYEGRDLLISVGDLDFRLTTQLVIDGYPIVIAKIAPTKGIWKLSAQILSWSNAREVTVELPLINIFCTDEPKSDRFRWADVPVAGGTRLICHNIPIRQTSTFVGRKKELDKLCEWLGEIEDYRTCLVFGDGGFGKTTLTLEFFNSLIEGLVETQAPLPSIISFYTAKRTRWSEDGLVHIKGMSEAMEDCVRELMYCLTPVLGKEWYKTSGRALIDKVATELKAEGFSRDDVLLIIDNTETLATSPADAEELAEFLARAAKTIGRIVITSRRRELLAALPVQVSKLSEIEALTLMQRLGAEYGAMAIKQAGEARLRRVCEQLMYKPLLIDTLARYVSRSSSSLQDGLDQILKKTNDQLLEFLYEDAWQRMPYAVQEVFMVLVIAATPLDGKCVGDVCTEIGVQHAEFQASLSETYFASIVDHGETYDLEIVELAKEFFRQKKRRLVQSEAERLEKIATRVDKLAMDRFEISKSYRTDRVADAFRSEFAKAAKIATFKKDYKSAREFFELALQEEPLNAALRERFSSFLFRTIGNPKDAMPFAEEATRLDPMNADAWLTLGLIQYKLGELKLGDESIDRAEKLGKPTSLCLLRKAIARYHTANREPYAKSSRLYLREAEAAIEMSMRTASRKDYFYQKNQTEAQNYLKMVKTLAIRLDRRKISSTNATRRL